jgi:hypothetical protein
VVDPDDFNASIAKFNAFNAGGGTPLSDEFKSEPRSRRRMESRWC